MTLLLREAVEFDAGQGDAMYTKDEWELDEAYDTIRQMKDDKVIVPIGEFSKMTKTTVKALRFYDESQLLKPAYVEATTGYRYYRNTQLIELQEIIAYRQIGLSIEDIQRIMSGHDATGILLERMDMVESELKNLQDQKSRINSLLRQIQEEFSMSYQVIVKTIPAYTVFYRTGIIPSFQEMSKFIIEAGEECRNANPGLKCIEPDYCYVTYTAKEFRHTDIELEYAQAVERRGVETANTKFKDIDATQAVCIYHKGPFDEIGKAYAFIYQWIEENDYEPTQNARERYIDGIWNKDDPMEWLTEIQVPVRKHSL